MLSSKTKSQAGCREKVSGYNFQAIDYNAHLDHMKELLTKWPNESKKRAKK